MTNLAFKPTFMQIVRNVLPSLPPERINDSAKLFDDLGLTSMGLVLLASEFESVFECPWPVEALDLAWHSPLGDLAQAIEQLCQFTLTSANNPGILPT